MGFFDALPSNAPNATSGTAADWTNWYQQNPNTPAPTQQQGPNIWQGFFGAQPGMQNPTQQQVANQFGAENPTNDQFNSTQGLNNLWNIPQAGANEQAWQSFYQGNPYAGTPSQGFSPNVWQGYFSGNPNAAPQNPTSQQVAGQFNAENPGNAGLNSTQGLNQAWNIPQESDQTAADWQKFFQNNQGANPQQFLNPNAWQGYFANNPNLQGMMPAVAQGEINSPGSWAQNSTAGFEQALNQQAPNAWQNFIGKTTGVPSQNQDPNIWQGYFQANNPNVTAANQWQSETPGNVQNNSTIALNDILGLQNLPSGGAFTPAGTEQNWQNFYSAWNPAHQVAPGYGTPQQALTQFENQLNPFAGAQAQGYAGSEDLPTTPQGWGAFWASHGVQGSDLQNMAQNYTSNNNFGNSPLYEGLYEAFPSQFTGALQTLSNERTAALEAQQAAQQRAQQGAQYSPQWLSQNPNAVVGYIPTDATQFLGGPTTYSTPITWSKLDQLYNAAQSGAYGLGPGQVPIQGFRPVPGFNTAALLPGFAGVPGTGTFGGGGGGSVSPTQPLLNPISSLVLSQPPYIPATSGLTLGDGLYTGYIPGAYAPTAINPLSNDTTGFSISELGPTTSPDIGGITAPTIGGFYSPTTGIGPATPTEGSIELPDELSILNPPGSGVDFGGLGTGSYNNADAGSSSANINWDPAAIAGVDINPGNPLAGFDTAIQQEANAINAVNDLGTNPTLQTLQTAEALDPNFASDAPLTFDALNLSPSQISGLNQAAIGFDPSNPTANTSWDNFIGGQGFGGGSPEQQPSGTLNPALADSRSNLSFLDPTSPNFNQDAYNATMQRLVAEVGGGGFGPTGPQDLLESAINRFEQAVYTGATTATPQNFQGFVSYGNPLSKGYWGATPGSPATPYTPAGGGFLATPSQVSQYAPALSEVLGGSNFSNLATGNYSLAGSYRNSPYGIGQYIANGLGGGPVTAQAGNPTQGGEIFGQEGYSPGSNTPASQWLTFMQYSLQHPELFTAPSGP